MNGCVNLYRRLYWMRLVRETLIKAFPAPDLRCEATVSLANPCASAGGSEETLI